MSVLTLDKRNSYTIQILFKIKKKALIDTSYLIIFLSCCKTKKLYQSKPFVWVCSLYQSTHTHPVPNGQCKCKSRVRAVGVVECGGSPRFFWLVLVGILPQVFRYSLFLSTGFDRIFIRHLSTNSDKFRPRQKVQTFDTVRHRLLSTNFDIPHVKFRQISTSSVFR